MSYSLILNNTNNIGANNNTFQYNFKGGSFQIPDNSEISISNIQIPYSWYNVASYYNNQTFQITFPNTATNTYTITLTQGFYAITDVNAFIQQFCIANNLYLIDGNGNYVYYINLSYNVATYKIQLLLFNVPTALPTNYTAPAGWAGYPATTLTPTFIVLNNSFGTLIGFDIGTFPPTGESATSVSFLSTSTPLGSNVNSLIVRCSLVDNQVCMPSDILDSIPINNVSYGSNINYSPNFSKWIKCKKGNFSNLVVVFNDQNMQMLYALDSNVLINLLIRTKSPK
jgi:hypothetical protein